MRRFVIKKGRSDNMTIHPYVAGILTVVFVELAGFFIYAIYLSRKGK